MIAYIIQMPMQMSVASVTISDVPRFTPANCFLLLASVHPNYYTVKTPNADFRTYNRMPQDQTVHGAENVSCLWAAEIHLHFRSFPPSSEFSGGFRIFPEVFRKFPEVFPNRKIKE